MHLAQLTFLTYFITVRSSSSKILLASMLLFATLSWGAEIDSFTPRYESVPEGLSFINQEVNGKIHFAVSSANKISSCNEMVLETMLGAELLRPFYGRLEHFANSSDFIPKSRVFFQNSVYNQIPYFPRFLFSIGEMILGFGYVLHEGRFLIGTDKFGHFFDEGHWFYHDLVNTGGSLEHALDASDASENGMNGLLVGGIKSYGDLNANYQGMRFWSEMLHPHDFFKDSKPYLHCENNQWVQVREFDFKNYIDAGWDEGINCSAYRSSEYEQAVLTSIGNLESKFGQKYQCPVYPEECVKLVQKHGIIATKLLSPKCIKAGAS